MPKEVKRKSLHHSAAPFKADGDDALDDIGVVFKMPPPKLSVNPFTGETLPDDDVRSMTSSHMSSASSASRWGRDGDGQVIPDTNTGWRTKNMYRPCQRKIDDRLAEIF